MKTSRLLLLLLAIAPLAAVHTAKACAGSCAAAATLSPVAASAEATPQRHPLRGVVIDVLPEKSALLVKHEAIPGVMKAMTMLLKVDAAVIHSAKKGGAITGLLVRKPDGWWLEDVQPAK